MNILVDGIVDVIVLVVFMRFGLKRLSPGRTFGRGSVWITSTVVIAFYLVLSLLYESTFEESPGLFLKLAVMFAVGWVFYSSLLRDIDGVPLSPRGTIGLAALPALAVLAGFSLIVVVHSFIFLLVFWVPSLV